MTWSDFHAESERFAIEAQMALKSRDAIKAAIFYKQAAEKERQALDSLDHAQVRTRGIIAVSAVALWYKAREYVQAEQLAYAMLSSSDIPAFARQDLRDLVQAIWTENSKQQAGVEFLPGQVMVSVKGGEVVTGGAPLDLIMDKVQTIQSMFYRTIEFLNGSSHRKGRPSRELQDSCRPWIFQSVPGSYQFSVAVQKPAQPDFFRKDVEPERVAQHFLEIVNASSGDDEAELGKLVPDPNYRDTFLKLARNLAPTGKTFESIEFRSAGEIKPVSLSVESRGTIGRQLKKQLSASKEEGEREQEELQGILRALHLDQDWLEVLVGQQSFRVVGLQDAVDDVIGPMVNRLVNVRIVRISQNKLKYKDIELVE